MGLIKFSGKSGANSIRPRRGLVCGQPTPTPTPPIHVVTNPATNITATTSTLNGETNPNGWTTTIYFEYGLTNLYGSTTANQNIGNGVANLFPSAGIIGLISNTTYHFRIVASNSAGTVFGNDLTFTPGMTRLASYPTGITNPTAMVLNSTKDYLYVAASGAEARGMVLDGIGGLFVTALGGANLYVAKIRVSDFVITNAITIAATNSLYRLLASDLSVNAVSLSGGLFSSTNSLWVNNSGYMGGGNHSVNAQLAYIQLPINLHTTIASNLGANNQLNAGVMNLNNTLYYAVEYNFGNLIKTDGGSYITQLSLGDAQQDYNSSTVDATDIYVGGQYKLSKINQASFTLTTQTNFAELSPSTINPPTRVCLSGTNYVYCVREKYTSGVYNPSWVTMFRKSDMAELSPLTLQAGESLIMAGAIDNTNNLMYMLSYNNGTIIKLSFTP